MNKKYEYNGQIYCKDDLSNQIDNYGEDLEALKMDDDNGRVKCSRCWIKGTRRGFILDLDVFTYEMKKLNSMIITGIAFAQM